MSRFSVVTAVLVVVLMAACSGSGESDFPDEFDPAIVELVDFVERERDLEFLHPVHVDFLTEEEFIARLTASETPTEDDLLELERSVQQLRALGLVQGDIDLVAASEQLVAASVTAFYDPDEKRIWIRGPSDLDASTGRP